MAEYRTVTAVATVTQQTFNADGTVSETTFDVTAESPKVLAIDPYVTIEPIEGGAVITVTDAQGKTTATIYNGKDGADGADGAPGEKGERGEKGEKGDKGDTGATGAQGPKGDKGDKGDTGDTGPKGDKGDTGATGATGAMGPQGPTGPQGPQGPAGPSVTVDPTLTVSGDAADAKATGEAVAQVKSAIAAIGKDGVFSLSPDLFAVGGLNDDGSMTTQAYLASTPNDIILPYPVRMNIVDSAYNINLLLKRSDGTYGKVINQSSLNGYIIDANQPFKIRVYKTGDFSRANLSLFANQVTFTTNALRLSTVATKNMELMQADGSQLLGLFFARGSVLNGNYGEYVLYRIATPNISSFDRDVTISVKNGFRFAIQTFDANDTLVADLGWFQNDYVLSAGQKFRMIIARDSVNEDTSEVVNVWEFYQAVTIQSEFKEYVDEQIGSVKEYVDEQIGSVEVNSSLLSAPIFSNGRAKLAAHTGYHVNAPENTTAAYIAAGKLGYWGIESDIQQTSDGYYVMCHDATVDRTTDGTGNIAEMTLAQIRALHITGDPSLKIPTFEEYLSICKWYGCVPVMELKGTITNTKESYQKIIGIVKDFGFSEKAVLFLGSKWALANFRQASESVPFGAIYQSGINFDWDTELTFCSQYPNVMMDWDIGLGLTATRVKQAHNADIAVGTFVADTVAQVRSAFEVGADCCTTNVILPTD